ncbi:hypothetical protein LguiA_034051 [Lonicera macranthoides]
MAVQAQYPSNALFLNRGVQEQKNATDYSLQPQPGGGGGFLDQTHMLFNSTPVGTNMRKRGREIMNLTVPINSSISMQSQPPPQLIDLTQLHNPQPNVVSTGLRLAFGDQQRQHQHSLASQSPVVLSLLSEDLATQIKQQRDEIDHFLLAQGEQMRRTLADKRQRHYRALVGAAEKSAARRLREKEAEAEKATRRNAELEARAAQLSAEAQAWQLKARAVEATAANLQAQLQHAIMSRGCVGYENEGGDMEEGARLTCGAGEAEDAESGYIDPDRVERVSEARCKACRIRVASVVVLPCRHLCVCRECDGVIQACPLCLSFRSSSVEVFFS